MALTRAMRGRIEDIWKDIQLDLEGKFKKPFDGTPEEKTKAIAYCKKVLESDNYDDGHAIIQWLYNGGMGSLIQHLSKL